MSHGRFWFLSRSQIAASTKIGADDDDDYGMRCVAFAERASLPSLSLFNVLVMQEARAGACDRQILSDDDDGDDGDHGAEAGHDPADARCSSAMAFSICHLSFVRLSFQMKIVF